MKIQAIRNNSIALFTDMRELNSKGIDDGCLTGEPTIRMIRDIFSQLGISCRGTIDAQAYINGTCVLIFARICACTDVHELFCFSTLEHLICACHALASATEATLIMHDGMYYLAIHNPADLHTLSEYGDSQPFPQLKYAYISEHGTTVYRGDSIALIREKFHLISSENLFFADSLPPCH